MMNTTVETERPQALIPHPLLERVGMMEGLSTYFAVRAKRSGKNRAEHRERHQELEADWQALVASVTEQGVIEPLKICPIPAGDETPRPMGARFFIVDGRNRWKAAQFAKLSEVPTIQVPAGEAPAIIAATVAARRHYTKGATAYLACLLNPEAALEGDQRQKSTLKKGAESPSRTECGTGPSALNAEGLAARFAVSLRLLEQAAQLYRLVESHPELRADAEADVWAGCGLGGILAGVKSILGSAGKDTQSGPEKAARSMVNFGQKGCESLARAWSGWSSLDETRREVVLGSVRRTMAEAPDDVKAALREVIA